MGQFVDRFVELNPASRRAPVEYLHPDRVYEKVLDGTADLGIGFPIGGARVSQALGAETALIDPANGATMWSGRASSSTAQDLTGQVTELAQTTIGALQGTGLL